MKINWTTLTISIIGFLKIALEQFGIHIPDNTADVTVNFIALAITLFGIFKVHFKPKAPVAPKS